MGKQLHRVNSGVQFEDYHPSCLWSILHILDHHHRNNAKKIVRHKKHREKRRAKCCGNPKTISMDRNKFEARGLLDADADKFFVEQHPTKVSPIDKSIKALVTEEMSEEENHNHWVLGFSAEPMFQQTNSIHHLEPSDYRLGKISTDWANPIIVLHKNANTSASELEFSSLKKTNRRPVPRNKEFDVCDSANAEGSIGQYQHSGKHAGVKSEKVMETSKSLNQIDVDHQVKEYGDVLEIFKVNKELFLNILQDPDVAITKQFHSPLISNRKAKLTKSGSFPVANISQARYLRPSTLEHKWNETWTYPKGEKFLPSIQVSKPDAVRSQEGYIEKTRPSLANEDVDSTIKHETSTSSWGSSRISNHQSWNQLVIGLLRDIQQRIKHAIKEGKKERGKANRNGFIQRVPTASTDGEYMPKSFERISMSQDGSDNSISCNETDGLDHSLSNRELHRMRRTASLNESMDKYARLFESSSRREAKLPHSKSLRLRNEDNISSKDSAPKFFRRISSLSDVESFYSLVKEVVHYSEKAVRTEDDCSTNAGSYSRSETKSSSFVIDTDKTQPLDAVVETQFRKNMDEGRSGDEGLHNTDEPTENMVEPGKLVSFFLGDQEIDKAMKPTVDLSQSCLVSEPEIMDTTECPISEGSESNPLCIHIDVADSSNVMKNGSREDSLPSLCSKVNIENDSRFLQFELDNDEASFNYVRDILHLSGFTGNESLGNWYSLDQPLDPSLFKEMETDLHHQVNYSEVLSDVCDHRLLFDLINVLLLEMNETSFTYFPRAFSFNHRIRPMPKGHRVIEEVWSRICWYLSFRSELDRSLDDIVAQDLTKGDGWMNHQFETECVALELEDLIFDELLQEVCS